MSCVRRKANVTSLLALSSLSSFETSADFWFQRRGPGPGDDVSERGLGSAYDCRRSSRSRRFASSRFRLALNTALRKAEIYLREL